MTTSHLSTTAISHAVSALRKRFPFDTIATEVTYLGKIHIKIISEKFNNKTERQKQKIVWNILKKELNIEEIQLISLALAYGTDEL